MAASTSRGGHTGLNDDGDEDEFEQREARHVFVQLLALLALQRAEENALQHLHAGASGRVASASPTPLAISLHA